VPAFGWKRTVAGVGSPGMTQEPPRFNGDRKDGVWLLHTSEDRMRHWIAPRLPLWLETYHLTISTILWSGLIVLFGWLAAKYDINWLWGTSVCIALQYLTDLLDGEVGRQRNTGLIKWGFYMDHFLDYFFLCAILIGYGFLLPDEDKYILFFVQALLAGFMVHSFLAFAATNKFKIAHMAIGPTEIRILFIVINTLLILFGKTHLAAALPYALGFSAIGLCVVVYQAQKEIWELDMEKKRQTENGPGL
jgi:phosphatidylglycerophosphate synthase